MKTTLNCPKCNRPLRTENINVTADIAKCDNCGAISSVSALVKFSDETRLEVPPKGSTIELTRQTDDSIKIVLPKRGFGMSQFFHLCFILFEFAIAGWMTCFLLKAPFLFVFFFIPVWASGFSLALSLLNSIYEVQIVTIDNINITFEKRRPLSKQTYVFPLSEIQEIKMMSRRKRFLSVLLYPRYAFRAQWSIGPPPPIPAIVSGAGTQHFFDEANDAEQTWVTRYLSFKVEQAKDRMNAA